VFAANAAKKQSAQAPVKKIEVPKHNHIELQASVLPIRKILQSESRLTYVKVHPIAQWVAVAGFLVILIVIIGIALFAAVFASSVNFSPWLAGLSVLFLAAPWLASLAIESRYMLETYRFSLQDEFLFIRSDVITPVYHIVPYENIQDAQVTQGFFDRIFGIASVVVSTPANTVQILSFNLPEAQKFREELLTLANLHRNMAE